VTCPALLQRLQRDVIRLGLDLQVGADFALEKSEAVVAKPDESGLFLEEYRFTTRTEDLTVLIKAIHQLTGIALTDLTEQLAIVSNDQFSYLAKYATPVTPHIAIDNDRKTVKPGALWYEETLPPETVLYFALSAHHSRAKDSDMPASAILNCITQDLFGASPYLQLGGNETVGMGWCKVTVLEA
jgi:CRISPR-associated protein Cmr4